MAAQNVNSGNYTERSLLPNESHLSSSGSACISRVDGGLGLVRGFVTSFGAGKQFVSNSYLSNFSSVIANPRVRRFFSSEAPKKKSKSMISVSDFSISFFIFFLFFFICLFWIICECRIWKLLPEGQEGSSERERTEIRVER